MTIYQLSRSYLQEVFQ
uniref:Uncharacterized protein n=1 Tax=Rhizophora mucronata TaxID=61149 RepID=A0A2P2PE39_RHIMU